MYSLKNIYFSVYVFLELDLLMKLFEKRAPHGYISLYLATKRVIARLATEHTIAQCLHRLRNWQQPSHLY